MVVTLGMGAQVETRVVSAVELRRAQMRIPDPPVPQSYIRSRNTWEPNPMHPDYLTAQKRVARARSDLVTIELVRLSCTLLTPLPKDDAWLRRILRYNIAEEWLRTVNLSDPVDLQVAYMALECIRGQADLKRIVDATVLTEDEIREFVRLLGVMRDGEYIDDAPTRHTIETGIGAQSIVIGQHQIVSPLDEYQACGNAGLNWLEWRSGKYEKSWMVEVVALNRVKMLIETHSSDAQQTASEKNNKPKARP